MKKRYPLRFDFLSFSIFLTFLLQTFLFAGHSLAQTAAPTRGVSGDLWADIVIGKSGFGEDTENDPDAKRLFNVGGVLVDHSVTPNRLFIYDSGNNRVLVVNSIANLNPQQGVTADFALGQPDLVHSAPNGDANFQFYPTPGIPTANTLQTLAQNQVSTTEGGTFATMAVDSQGNLYVPDFFNNRVLRYNAPFTANEAAVAVWGQPDFKSNLCNQGASAPTSTCLCLNGGNDGYGAAVAVDSLNNLWVVDPGNNRVLRFSFNASTGLPQNGADLVIGQSDFISSIAASGSKDLNHLRTPTSVRVDSSGKVYVSDIPLLATPVPGGQDCDKYDGRVAVFTPPIPTVGATAATILQQGLANPGGLELDTATNGIWVDDFCTHEAELFVNYTVTKVLGQDQPQPSATRTCPTGDNFTPSGQPFLYDDNNSVRSDILCHPRGSIGVAADGSVFLSSVDPQDVWRFPQPIPTFQPGKAYSADMRVFRGHQYGIPNDVDAAGLGNPLGVAVAGNQLIVADEFRLLYWNGAPNLSNGQTATGYAGVTNVSLLLGNPFGRIRADQNNHLWSLRGIGGNVQVGTPPVYEIITGIQVYTVPFTSNGAMPVTTINSPLPVLGQAGVSLNWTVLTGIAPDPAGDQVWVSDTLNNRVFRIRNPLTNPVVDVVLGQPNINSIGCNQTGNTYYQVAGVQSDYCEPCNVGPTASSLYMPGAVRLDHHGNLYVSDDALECWGNYRMLRWNASQFPTNQSACTFAIPAAAVYGQNGSFTSASCANAPGTPGVCAPWEPAFNSDDSAMVVGLNPYQDNNQRFPVFLQNPLQVPTPSGSLKDFTSQPYSADFDSGDNLYMIDEDRNRCLVYLKPFAAGSTSTPTPTISPTPTVGGGCGSSTASLQLKEYTSLNGNQASENFEVINTGTTTLNLSQITVKFWVDDTTGQSVVGAINYGGCYGPSCTAVSGVAITPLSFSPACGPDGTHQANWETTISTTSSGTLGAGVTWGNIQTSVHLANFGSFSSTASWYSPASVGGGNTYTGDLHFAVYYQGNLVTASGGVPPSCRAAATCTPAGPTGTPTVTPTLTPTASPSRTFTATISPTFTSTVVVTTTPSSTPTSSVTPTASFTASPTATSTASRTPTLTSTALVGTSTSTPTRTLTSTPTLTVTQTATSSVTTTPSASPTAGGVCGTSSLALQLEEFGTCGSNQNQQTFEVINKGTSAVTLSDITIKFWADDTTGSAMVGAVNYGGCFGQNCTAVTGTAVNTVSFSPACGSSTTQQANWEITLSNTDTAILGAGVTWANLQTAVHLSSFANFSPGTGFWYSPCNVGSGSTYTNNLNYALYIRGNLATASGGTPPSCRPNPTCTATPPGGVAKPSTLREGTTTFTPTPSLTENNGLVRSVVAAPNLSQNGTPIQFRVTLGNPASIQLGLFSLTGERVDELSASGSEGLNTLTWALNNRSQETVASGLYFYVLRVEDGAMSSVQTGKVVVLH